MRGVDQLGRFPPIVWNLLQCPLHAIHERFHKSRVVVEHANLVHNWHALSDGLLRARCFPDCRQLQ